MADEGIILYLNIIRIKVLAGRSVVETKPSGRRTTVILFSPVSSFKNNSIPDQLVWLFTYSPDNWENEEALYNYAE